MTQSLSGDGALTVEDIIARWCLRCAALTNLELAHLSNLSRQWRHAAHHAVLEQSASPRIGETLLLLPSMVRYVMKGSSDAMDETRIPAPISPSRSGSSPQESAPPRWNDTFCAAWFDPDGIQELRISLTSNGVVSIRDKDLSQNSPSPLVFGEPIYEVSDNDENKDDTRSSRSSRKQQTRHPQLRSTAAVAKMNRSTNDDLVATCYEWRGYRTAMDVLRPFGYCDSFVESIFQSLQPNTRESPSKIATNGNYSSIRSEDTERLRSPVPRKEKDRETTYAVRGAVIARPESYCDCVDIAAEQLRKIRFAAAATDDEDEFNDIRIQEYKQLLIRKEIRRRQLQRDVLPRVVTRNFGTSASSQHRCVQFLNASGGHAVCMLTPPFACGPITEPVTVFCVGIATEDGCFLSGLHHRFELGHLYPSNEIDEISELSPVCISTECWTSQDHQCMTRQNHSPSSNHMNDQSIHTCEDDDIDPDGDEDDNENDLHANGEIIYGSDDDSCSSSSEEALLSRKCECSFKGVGEKISALDEGKPRIVHRGHLGPGVWHCYVAVFDGERSCIRIDGVAEPMHTEKLEEYEIHTPPSSAILDGLTIGSDHCFGMSLCCGNGSGGEGEGAIAELAVFKGRLDVQDIEVIEKSLMKKHGLVTPTDVSCTGANVHGLSLWKENDFARQAHALFFLPETDDGTTNLPSSGPLQIPLRFLSQHRSVAWKQTNPVTGDPIHVSRIGCKPGGASSSDL